MAPSEASYDMAALPHCVGTGFVVLDVIRNSSKEGTIVERRHAGGSCGNVLAILSYLGARSTVVGRIGADHAGAELISDLQRWRVDVQLLRSERERKTPVIIQEGYVDSRGKPRYRFSRICPMCGAVMAGYRPLLASWIADIAKSLPSHGIFYFDRVAPGTFEMARLSRKQGALVVFEPSGVKDEELFIKCLSESHVFKYSRERLSGIEDLVNRSSVPVEIQTKGAAGLQFRVRRGAPSAKWRELPAIVAPVLRDAIGSGDWCTAGFIAKLTTGGTRSSARLVQEKIVAECLRFGQALAALNCAYEGARGAMYELNRKQAVNMARQLLENDRPKLPSDTVRTKVSRRFASTCVVCASHLTAK